MENLFGKRLREARSNRKKTQENVAEFLGVSYTTYGAWERGTNEPSLGNLLKLCKHLDVSADWLLGLERASSPVNLEAVRSEADMAAATLHRLLEQLKVKK